MACRLSILEMLLSIFDMLPMHRYIGQEFPCAMRLLENDGQISPENMGKNTILAVLYLHIKWKYDAKRLMMIFSWKDGAQFTAIIARLPL